MTPSEEIRFECDGVPIVVWKRRVHQWRTDLMIRLQNRDYYLTRMESAITRGEVKQLARTWLAKDTRILKGS